MPLNNTIFSTTNNDKDDLVFITGATGLVGLHLTEELVARGKRIRALYRSSIPATDWAEKAEWIQGDILDVVLLEEAMQNVQQVYHCAAVVSFQKKEKKQLFQTNVEGTANVVNAAINANVKKLLFVSSVSALGRMRKNSMVNETMNWSEETSNSEYGKTKYLAEMEVWRGAGEGLQTVIVNPSIILGPGDWNKGSSAIFKTIYNQFPWYTDGVSGFVDIQDVVKAMILLMENNVDKQRFILNAENISYKVLFDEIAANFKTKAPYKKVSPFMAEAVWRLEALKGKLSGKDPLLTKETARTAQAKVYFDNSKLLKLFPGFQYNPIQESIKRIVRELKEMHGLP